MQAETVQLMRARVESLRADFVSFQALQLEAEQRLEALRSEPFAPRFDEDERTALLQLQAFRAGALDCERKARELESQADALESAQREQLEAVKRESERVRIVRRVEVESFGVEHAQYFRGAGAEDFDEVTLGVGNSEREALADALESLATAGGWTFKPEDGWPSEPDAEDYSETDEVSAREQEARSDALGSKPEPRYRVALYPHNGSGPYVKREGLALSDAQRFASDYCAEVERDGFDVSDLTPETCATTGVALARFEVQREDSGVSDFEGILSVELEPSSRRELETYARNEERLDEEPSEFHYYVALRVSAEPESEREEYGLPVVELDGSEFLFASDDDEAERAALEAARGSLWAFSLDFLSSYAPALRDSRTLEALRKVQGEACEDFGAVVEALLGERIDEALRDALATDGRGHFLASYDGDESEDSDGAFRYRIG